MCGGPSKASKGRLPIPKQMSFHVVYFLKTLGTRASKIMIPGVKYNVSISISGVGQAPRLLLHCCTTTLTWNWTRSVGESTQPKIALHLWASQHGALNLEICWESREVWLAVVILGSSFVNTDVHLPRRIHTGEFITCYMSTGDLFRWGSFYHLASSCIYMQWLSVIYPDVPIIIIDVCYLFMEI